MGLMLVQVLYDGCSFNRSDGIMCHWDGVFFFCVDSTFWAWSIKVDMRYCMTFLSE